MEGPVKDRLTGALILVAALVVIVPEMIYRPGPDAAPASTAVPLAQPADEGAPLRTYSMELNDSGEQVATAQATLAPQPAVAVVADPAPSPEPAAPASTVPAVTEKEAPAVTSSPAQARPVDAPAQAGKWWTQLGSFSARDNAERLTRKLRADGFAIEMSKVGAPGKELYRVRAGPVSSRAEVQALQARLAANGHKSTIVAP